MPLTELSGQLGADAYTEGRVTALGHEVATDWAGRRAIGVEVAAEVYGTTVAAREDHSSKWDEYQRYLEQRKADAEAERLAEIAKARAEASYNQNLWIDHPFGGAAYLPR